MVRQYIGARYVPKFYENSLNPLSNEWEENVTYEALTVVTYLNDSYTSKKPVPVTVGNPRNNPEYWSLTGAYNAQVEQYKQEVEEYKEEVNQAVEHVEEIAEEINEKKFIYVSVSDFGAIGDGVTDDTEAIQTGINSINKSDILLFEEDKIYRITDTLLISNERKINLNGSTILYDGTNQEAIKLYNAEKSSTTLSSGYNSNSDGKKLTLTSVLNVEIGDILRLHDENTVWDSQRAYYRNGGITCVEQKNGSNIICTDAFPLQNMTSGTEVKIYTPVENVEISNGTIKSIRGIGIIAYGIRCIAAKNVNLHDLYITDFQREISLENSYNSRVENVLLGKSRPNATEYLYDGYGIAITDSRRTYCARITGTCGQHAIATGGWIPVYETVVDRCNVAPEFGVISVDGHANVVDMYILNSELQGVNAAGNVTIEHCSFTRLNNYDGGSENVKIEVGATSKEGFRNRVKIKDCCGTELVIKTYAQTANCYIGSINIENTTFKDFINTSANIVRTFEVSIINSYVMGQILNTVIAFMFNIENSYFQSGSQISVGRETTQTSMIMIKNITIPKKANVIYCYGVNVNVENVQITDSSETGTYAAYLGSHITFIGCQSAGLDSETINGTDVTLIGTRIGSNAITATNKGALNSFYKNGNPIT